MADISKIKPNGANGTEYDVKDATARNAIANKANDTQTFTEASTRANIASGENMATLFGKIKKFFTDLKTVAFTGAYSDLTGTPTIPTVNNATLTIQKNGTTVKTFTANASSDVTANITMSKSDVGLGNVDNTADANKSVNYASNATTANNVKLYDAQGSATELTSAARQAVVDSDYYFPTGKAVISYLNSNLGSAVLLCSKNAGSTTGIDATFSEKLSNFMLYFVVAGYGSSGNNAASKMIPTSIKDNITMLNAASTQYAYYVQNITDTGCKILGNNSGLSTHYVRIYGVGRLKS